jgi:hypothetical protein
MLVLKQKKEFKVYVANNCNLLSYFVRIKFTVPQIKHIDAAKCVNMRWVRRGKLEHLKILRTFH